MSSSSSSPSNLNYDANKRARLVDFQPSKYRTVLPYVIVKDAPKLISFYTNVFQGKELYRLVAPDSSIVHSEVAIGDSVLMLSEESGMFGTSSPLTLTQPGVSLILYVESVDEVLARALEAGGLLDKAAADMFWGDRMATVIDPSGHRWSLITRFEEVSSDEMKRRAQIQGFKPEFKKDGSVPFKPPGSSCLTACLHLTRAARALSFYVDLFSSISAQPTLVLPGPPSSSSSTSTSSSSSSSSSSSAAESSTESSISISHGEVRLGDTVIMLGESSDTAKCPAMLKGSAVSMCVYVPNVDETVKRAVEKGAKLERPIKDEFYGARVGVITDPFGHKWSIQTQVEFDLSNETILERGNALFASMVPAADKQEVKKIHGACLCGAVSFSFSLPTKFVCHCHCSICRRSAGAASVTWLSVPKSSFSLSSSSSSSLTTFASSSHGTRQFCRVCGSSLFSESTKLPDEVHIVRAALNDDVKLDKTAGIHIFYANRVNWITHPDDELTKFDTLPGL